MKGKLILEDNSEFEGLSFGADKSVAGEVVFSTGMVGYPQAFTDPSFTGQILILTYPIIGSYGVPDKKFWESDGLKISGLIVSNYIDTPSHFQSKITLSKWLKKENIPALEIANTRGLTQKIREKGVMLGKIIIDNPEQNKKVKLDFIDPNKENLVAKVSTKTVVSKGDAFGGKTVLLIDCGAKRNITQCLVDRGVKVITVPWNFDPFMEGTGGAGEGLPLARSSSTPRSGKAITSTNGKKPATGPARIMTKFQSINFDAIVISNGPGDPKMADKTISIIQKALQKKIPVLGICLGHQLLALAAGGDTQKLKFGHRSQNQPCILNFPPTRSDGYQPTRCYITTQNHGFAVNRIPEGFKPWFTNANDGSNEGIIHTKLPFMSVQFHPEAMPGPVDTEWIFDYFLERIP